jgi:serine/threonine protein kinase
MTGGVRHQPSVGLHAAIATPSSPIMVRLGRYQIVERIATGGMAEVYLAVHGELAGFRTPVVLKKVLPHLANNPQFIDMFLDEARIASMLDHPNVVRIYEVGRSGSEYFLAMELVQGKSLSAVLRRAHEGECRLDARLAAFIVAQAAAGLHHAHNLTDPLGNPLGLVHRDVSPQNILISFEGSVKVIDFGIARALGRITETQTGGMKGKFGYMSPEQARGEDVDLRTDIFALGVVLWESITGKRLFQRENDLATMRALVYEPIPRPSSVADVPPELEAIVMRALARNPKLRFGNARDLAGALEKWVVNAGGTSVSDLSSVIKGYFTADHSSWQQTLRTAVNLPAVTEADLAGTPAPTAPTTNPGNAAPARRWPFVLVGATVLGAALVTVLLARAPVQGPPSGMGGAAIPAPANSLVTPPVPLPPSSVAPLPATGGPENPPTEPGEAGIHGSEDPSHSSLDPNKPKSKKKRTPGSKSPSPGQDRRPNPF